MSELSASQREYELPAAGRPMPWRLLIVLAVVLWGGAWWFGSHASQSQGKTSTPLRPISRTPQIK